YKRQVLCPTRELCLQIARDLEKFAKYIDNVHVVAVYGGANIGDQLRQIRRGGQNVVATPRKICLFFQYYAAEQTTKVEN
ncbi:DEAD/DEAH box helicase, partial [Sphingobacterium daejeonense]|uniref:DEAD/DEAH box helicase n=1 Tax=Sphingobacterium daejeonense TaxID=371142 RepID=UPI003D316D47